MANPMDYVLPASYLASSWLDFAWLDSFKAFLGVLSP